MAEIRAPDIREQAKLDYLKGMKYKDIAEKYEVSLNTIKSWVKRYEWSKEKKQKGAHKTEKGAHKKSRLGAPLGNKNAVGHGAPKGNLNAEKHGFFSKYLPEETLELMKEIEQKEKLDILWENITIQYAAIIRSQKIMYVKNQEDITKYLRKEKIGDTFTEKEWEFQYAWDKQAKFLQAQSRAMAELRNMIKQYDELVNSGLGTEEQKLRIQKLKADIETSKKDDKPIKIEFVKASDRNG